MCVDGKSLFIEPNAVPNNPVAMLIWARAPLGYQNLSTEEANIEKIRSGAVETPSGAVLQSGVSKLLLHGEEE